MKIQPYFLGSGSAAQAIEKSLSILATAEPDFQILPSITLKRGAPWPSKAETKAETGEADAKRVAILANPHGLHADAILAAERAGFDFVFCEKPAAVTIEQLQSLEKVKIPVAVFHGYRASWGPRKLRSMIESGELGTIFAIEGRLWQSSFAAAAIAEFQSGVKAPTKWKDDPALSGPGDAILDLAPHWVDLAFYLADAHEGKIQGRRFYANSPSPHRDSHIQLAIDFPSGLRAQGSISRTIHGAANDFEIHVLGSLGTASWGFMDADRIRVGRGTEFRVIPRAEADLGSLHRAYHAMGWIEGYIEILRRGFMELNGDKRDYPSLRSSVPVMRALFEASWT